MITNPKAILRLIIDFVLLHGDVFPREWYVNLIGMGDINMIICYLIITLRRIKFIKE